MKHAKHGMRRNNFKTLGRLAGLVAVVGISGIIGVSLLLQSNAAAPTTQAGLAAAIENVTASSVYRYTSYDNRIQGMDTAKVITNPGGGYMAVYHSGSSINLATSADLKNWTWKAKLDNGTQPTITASSDGGFLVAHEANNGGGYIRVLHYPNLTALYTAKADRAFSAPRTLSSCNEGTPNFNSVSLNPTINNSVIKIGMHYHAGCNVDREAIGTLTNFSNWSAVTAPNLDNAVANAARAAGQNIGGNIGDRDIITYGGTTYALIEGQLVKNDFGSWRTFLYNYSTGQAQLLNIKTHRGSKSFANPTITAVKGPDGSAGLAIGMYIHAPVAGEGGGQLIYYVKLADSAPASPTPAPAKPSPTPTPPAPSSKPSNSSTSASSSNPSKTSGSTTSGASGANGTSSNTSSSTESGSTATNSAESGTSNSGDNPDYSNVDLASLIPKSEDKNADSAPAKKTKSMAAAGLIAFAALAAIIGTIFIIKKHRAHQAQTIDESLTVYDDEAPVDSEIENATIDQNAGYTDPDYNTQPDATYSEQPVPTPPEEVAVAPAEEPITAQPEEQPADTAPETAVEAPQAEEPVEPQQEATVAQEEQAPAQEPVTYQPDDSGEAPAEEPPFPGAQDQPSEPTPQAGSTNDDDTNSRAA